MADHRALVITEPGAIALHDLVDPAYVRYPPVPGHEWSGVIEAVGPGVTGLTPGQPVIAEGIIPDRICAQCARGNTNLCLTYDEIGFTRAGAAADQLRLPAQVVHPLAAQPGRSNVRLEEAALAEPAAVAWRGIIRGQPRPGERVAVVGTGMGVLAVQSGTAGFFLVWLGLMALVGGVYPAAGRVVHRRLRIRRSRYVLTSRRLITTWWPLGGGPPVVVQASLSALLPPVLRGTSVITGLAAADGSSRLQGWKALPWPAATVSPPVFIGLANAQEVAGLIGDAQIATRAREQVAAPPSWWPVTPTLIWR